MGGDGPLHRTAQRAHPPRWYKRILLKWCVFGLVTFFVLFPNPAQFVRHVSHLWNLDEMIQPEAPGMAAWEAEFRRDLKKNLIEKGDGGITPKSQQQPAMSPQDVQRAVEKFIYSKIRYAWDWDVWGSADYMPTVGEMFHQAELSADGRMREDCDGRAVMAASLLQRLGYEASVVTDLRHVWVITPEGEWMGPGRKKTIVSSSDGNLIAISSALGNLPVAVSFGMAVFPLWRELVLLATAFALMAHRRISRRTAAFAGLLLLQGLLFMRLGHLAPMGVGGSAMAWPAWVGGVHFMIGTMILLAYSHRARRLHVGG